MRQETWEKEYHFAHLGGFAGDHGVGAKVANENSLEIRIEEDNLVT